jgi:hypothetical protein
LSQANHRSGISRLEEESDSWDKLISGSDAAWETGIKSSDTITSKDTFLINESIIFVNQQTQGGMLLFSKGKPKRKLKTHSS